MTSIAQLNGACPRCHGFMVPMTLDGSEDTFSALCELPGWRCVNCGERIDQRIVANRRASQLGMVMGHSPRLP
jgi:hypothetical protein